MLLRLATLLAFLLLSTVNAQPLHVVVSTSPIAALVHGILGDKGKVTQIVPANMSPHTYTLKPADLINMDDAQIIFWVGPQLEMFLAKPISQLKDTKKIVTLIDTSGLTLYPQRSGNNWQSFDEHMHPSVDNAPTEKNTKQASEKMNLDPHIWLDPINAKKLLAKIAETLSELDPANRTYYLKRLHEKTEELTVLDKTIAQEMAPIKDHPYLVFHDGYQYLERRYHLTDLGTVLVNPEVPLSGKQLKEIHQRIQRLKVQCVFSEPQVNEKIAASIVRGTQAQLAILDPLDSGLPIGWDGYTALLKKDVSTLLGCLR